MSVGSQSVPSGVKGSLNCFFKADIIKKMHQLHKEFEFHVRKNEYVYVNVM